MANHYVINGFKRRKRNKRPLAVFLTTTLGIDDISDALKVCGYHHDTITDVDSFVSMGTGTLSDWRKGADIDQTLTLFDELRIIKAVGNYRAIHKC